MPRRLPRDSRVEGWLADHSCATMLRRTARRGKSQVLNASSTRLAHADRDNRRLHGKRPARVMHDGDSYDEAAHCQGSDEKGYWWTMIANSTAAASYIVSMTCDERARTLFSSLTTA
jgi:hypothetical protein